MLFLSWILSFVFFIAELVGLLVLLLDVFDRSISLVCSWLSFVSTLPLFVCVWCSSLSFGTALNSFFRKCGLGWTFFITFCGNIWAGDLFITDSFCLGLNIFGVKSLERIISCSFESSDDILSLLLFLLNRTNCFSFLLFGTDVEGSFSASLNASFWLVSFLLSVCSLFTLYENVSLYV